MDDYAGRVLADRYRLPLPPSEAFDLVETRAFDTYSGQEVLVRQIPLPEVVDAEVLGDERPYGAGPTGPGGRGAGHAGRGNPKAADPAVRRALVAASAAAQVPDHPRLDQVFHVFAEAGSLWIISELVSARPLAALLAERTLSPHRAAEVAADVLTALRALHSQGWTHRNITARTVLICDDGRAILTGLAAGAAEEALCGYDPVPRPVTARGGSAGGTGQGAGPTAPGVSADPGPGKTGGGGPAGGRGAVVPPQTRAGQPGPKATQGGPAVPGSAGRPASKGAYGTVAASGTRGAGVPPQGGPAYRDQGAAGGFALPDVADGREEALNARAVRSGAIAAYHAAARAAAARAAAEAAGLPATGASTWGGGSAASGTAPAPESTPPWNADALVHGPSPAPARTERPGTNGSREPAAKGGGTSSPAVPGAGTPEARKPGTAELAPGSRPVSESWAYTAVPGGALAAERARQARMVVVGAVTERWAPEQAWPVQENWQLAPPVGPAADLWALGALLFRVVQGHAPYPEDSTAELVQVVCAEPPAYAEECGALRPVVESLMRKDPSERPEFEELRGWLRSLIRSAPEPDIGSRTVTVPSIGAPVPADGRRLPVIRRRGELVRRRRGRTSTASAEPAAAVHGRHKRTAKETLKAGQAGERSAFHSTGHLQEQRVRTAPAPHRLGRLLLGVILLALIGAVLYALLFMPRAEQDEGRTPSDHTGAAGALSAAPDRPGGGGSMGRTSASGIQGDPTEETTGTAKGFTLRKDPKGFMVAVAANWQRRGENERGQVVYVGGDYELIVVPGRDKVSEFGGDPMTYQQEKEPELAPYRSSTWSGASGLRRIDVGGTATAEGTFNWNDSSGRQVYVRNAAMILGGRYHLLLVRGPMDEQRSVDAFFEQATATYRAEG
ncbi:serine/threonine protein kinase [Streptomyces cinnamoneus]|uniref:Serine/threonine protein kinase n=1 Tax=Streptomyces cinnamoneus TaxID=53446 RepID=A0A2G1XIS3_STRCJ|nr:protein kinase [Streptomyces cinnamoneus]PHQ51100.1 serine/threonine protein kinase [Streptomyces cinnamoneus]PPT13677.1 serine/threonine protein kinase [Streptomyces cinnamoneus]